MTAATCSICHHNPPRPGLKTCAACALQYAQASRERRQRRRAERLPKGPPRFTIAPTRPRPGDPPEGFRVARGTRYAVDVSGLRAVRRGADRQWHPVDLEAAPLVRRAMAALVLLAWGDEP